MLKPGEIILVDCPLVDPPHDKFVVVLCLEPKPLFVFINSKINNFVRNRQALLNAQVTIDRQNHQFLDHDSYIDCAEPFTWSIEDFEKQLQQETERKKRQCSESVIRRIIDAINTAPTIALRDKAAIASALNSISGAHA